MFECKVDPEGAATVLTSTDLARGVAQLARINTTAGDAELIDQITQLERLKAACAAAQADLTAAFVTQRTAGLTAKELTDERAHRSIAAQIALARRDSPARGNRHVGLATALTREMPHTHAALRNGDISEWRATLLVRETACLTAADRAAVDAELAGKLHGLGDRQTAAAATRLAQKLDPAACVARHRKAATERRVSIRPAPDTMAYLSALLPVATAVAVWAALTRHADTATSTGDHRSRGQIMADELVSRITQPAAAPASPTENTSSSNDIADTDLDPAPVPHGVNLDIQLLMTDRTLFDQDNEPATLIGHGPIPAPLARHLIRNAGPHIRAWIRRLYTDPHSGHLVTADSHRRTFTHAARQFLIARDQVCRTPWCDAPIRHADHLIPHSENGPTHVTNGRGTCENCNYTKQAPGWRTTAAPNGHGITLTTPTGHLIYNDPPPPPRSAPWATESPIEARLRKYLERVA